MQVDTIIADTAYCGANNLKLAAEEHIALVSKLNPSISHGVRKDADKFEYNKDAGMYVCPAGHMTVRKAKDSWMKDKRNPREVYYFAQKADTQVEQLKFQQSTHFKEKYRERYKIEAKNAELKQVYGYDRAKSYGLAAMQMQGALTIFAANLKRILKLM